MSWAGGAGARNPKSRNTERPADRSRSGVSELVTNAVSHGRGGLVSFSLVCDAADTVRIEVADHSPGAPMVRHPGPDAENGRGMLLVSALAGAWGTIPLPTGKQVWAELPGRRRGR
ncbi:ATP-binding protein [Streptomyces lichenis]|uniref:ATP-binding protein n=1 Tax=Streptomyces lichenis TaxID=2306967 RepID=A0ABT0IJ92_9ACTN|nr:ATP-binding protein [Streptomyces lichenis]MCK8681403.1 ATP-binding protein [Streptomyces lichenis]